MAIYARTKMAQSSKANTQYLTIPTSVVTDSQYPFEKGDQEVEIYIDSNKEILIVAKPTEEGEKSG